MPYTYHVFLSHNSKDKLAVEALARLLQEKYTLKCWLDKWNLVPGEPWQEALEDALDDCETLAVFVGPHTISPWENEEMRSALEVRVHDKSRRVIPVLLPGAPDSRDLKLPRFLARLTWVDLRAGHDDEDALYRLYCGIQGISPGSSTPGKNLPLPTYHLPPGSYLPFPRNTLFTGREADLQKLSALCDLRGGNIVVSQAVTGMGGIGKTQLAVEFAYRYGARFCGVHWLDLRDPTQFETEIAKNGENMLLQPWPDELPAQVALTLQTWHARDPRLLILDNFEEVGLANDVLARFYHPSIRLLITSRRSDWPANLGLTPLGLEVFTLEESLKFLSELLKNRNDQAEDLQRLAEHLGHLPLALELAGRYLLKHPRLGISGYLTQLESILDHRSMDNWKPQLQSATKHDLSLAQTFALSWEQVREEASQKAFIMAGFLAPNAAIPLDIFEKALNISQELCDETLEELYGLGLLRRLEDGSPATHPLLAEFARRLDLKNANLAKLSEILAETARGRNTAVDRLGDYSLFTPLITHVRSVAKQAEDKGIEKASSLWNSLGYHIHAMADYSGAIEAFERALKIDEAAFGPDHPEAARDVNNLGGVLKALGDFEGTIEALERALKIDETAYGADHPNVATIISNLGSVLKDLGDLPGARAAFERALWIHARFFGPDHPQVARDVNNLGMVLKDLGDFEGAIEAFERALKIDENALGGDHPQVARDVNNLGMVLKDLGDLSGAGAAFERALKINEDVFGPDHPEVATDVNNLGMVLKDLGDLSGAGAAFERALKIDEKAYGEKHPNVATIINNLGLVLKDLGDLSGAGAAFERALWIGEATYGGDHPEVAIYVNNLGNVLQDLGDLAGARTAYERALQIDEQSFGPDHPNVARDVNNLGGVLMALGDLPGARAAGKRAIKIFKKFLPEDHPSVKTVERNLDVLPE